MALHFDGTNWSSVAGTLPRYCNGVWGSSANDVWIAGGDTHAGGPEHSLSDLLHWDGKQWRHSETGAGSQLRAIWGATASDLWLIGDGALLRRTTPL
jgi:hypothetical protein